MEQKKKLVTLVCFDVSGNRKAGRGDVGAIGRNARTCNAVWHRRLWTDLVHREGSAYDTTNVEHEQNNASRKLKYARCDAPVGTGTP